MHYTLTTVKRGTARRLGIRRPCPCMAIPARVVFDPSASYEAAVNNMLTMQYNGKATWLVQHMEQATLNRHICHGECGNSQRLMSCHVD